MSPGLEARLSSLLAEGAHDQAAAEAVRGYGSEIFGYLLTLLGDEDEADDVFAAFSEKLLERIAQYRGEGPFQHWAYRIAWSTARDHLRAARRRRERRLYTSEISRIALAVRSETRPHLRTEGKDRLARLRAELDPEEQSMLTLRLDRGLSWDEIAGVLDVPAPTLRKRFERLRARVAERLAAGAD